MSIIGTRPPLISETNLYELHHRARLAIKPGITGMWQVSGRSDITDFEEVVRLDKEYIPMIFGCTALIDWFVPIFFGSGYEPVGNIIKILSCMFIVLSLGRLFGTMLIAINQQMQYTIVTIVAAVMNLLLNLVFLFYFHMGAIGVAVASVISEITATVS